jgi:hypothetical protein
MNQTTSIWHYTVYGLHLVTNRPIPALIVESKHDLNQIVHVTFEEVSQRQTPPDTNRLLYTSPGIAESGEPFFQVWKSEQNVAAYLAIQYTNGRGMAQFFLNQEGSQVSVTWTNRMPFGDVITYFLGPVLGCLLRLRQFTCLHAGVVAVGKKTMKGMKGMKAIAIIGPKGAGKSTTVAALAYYQRLPILSDDIGAISINGNEFIVQSGYPRLRLWPTTVELLPDMTVEQLPRILSIAEKRYFTLTPERDASQWRFQQDPLPLAAIYVLDTREANALSIRSLWGGERLFALGTNVYPDYTLDSAMRARDFDILGRLAASIPVREVRRPDGLHTYPQVCQALVEDIQARVLRDD